MPLQSHKGLVLRSHLISMLVRMIFSPPVENIEEQPTLLVSNLLVDLKILRAIRSTRYLLAALSSLASAVEGLADSFLEPQLIYEICG